MPSLSMRFALLLQQIDVLLDHSKALAHLDTRTSSITQKNTPIARSTSRLARASARFGFEQRRELWFESSIHQYK